MIFGTVDIRNCEGCYLAHSLRTDAGRIAKGTLISASIAKRLAASGIEHLVVARLEAQDVHEDDAAERIAAAFAGSGVTLSSPRTGRVNLHADVDGLCDFDAQVVREINAVDEGITLATLPENQWVANSRMVATVKIIPYAVTIESLERVLQIVSQQVLQVVPALPHRAELIQTRLASVKEAVLDKTRRVVEDRLSPRRVDFTRESRCNHSCDDLQASLADALQRQPDWILIVGASAISDRADVIPSAIQAAGGHVDRYGVPVDPGNLLLLAHHGDTRIIGLPGCARSPRYNGLDMVIDRLACNVPVTDRWLSSLSVGGLLTEVADRPTPRVDTSGQHRVGALLLAAGSSRRAGSRNKLLARYADTVMVSHVASIIKESRAERVVAITGFEHERIESELASTGIDVVFNAAHASGMASSVVAGVSRMTDLDAVLVCLGDMPHVSVALINALIAAYQQHPDKSIFIPVYNEQRGNPVLFGKVFFDSLLALTGDIGARKLVSQFPDAVYEVVVAEDGVLVDYDTNEDLERLQAEHL